MTIKHRFPFNSKPSINNTTYHILLYFAQTLIIINGKDLWHVPCYGIQAHAIIPEKVDQAFLFTTNSKLRRSANQGRKVLK